MPQPPSNLKDFKSLLQIISDLRGPDGCPWDLEQTHQSLAAYAIEEVHELVEAIEQNDDSHMCEELGDVLFQVVLHAQMAEERNKFNLSDVIESISSKVVRRHPHVFSGLKVSNNQEIIANWDQIKKEEALLKPKKSKLIDIPDSLPALQRSYKIGEKTATFNFDWTEVRDVLQQLKAEIVELEQAMDETVSPESFLHVEHEMGDVLFSAAQLSRHLKIEPESVLREANRRFLKRFAKMVELSGVPSEKFKNLLPEEKQNFWSAAKKLEN
ncbi:MAG: nucleoside triphosphate pyrophosphohydrolase [Pseudobdellovibrio sp.]